MYNFFFDKSILTFFYYIFLKIDAINKGSTSALKNIMTKRRPSFRFGENVAEKNKHTYKMSARCSTHQPTSIAGNTFIQRENERWIGQLQPSRQRPSCCIRSISVFITLLFFIISFRRRRGRAICFGSPSRHC